MIALSLSDPEPKRRADPVQHVLANALVEKVREIDCNNLELIREYITLIKAVRP